MVGSITFTKKKGDYVQKGDEVQNFVIIIVTFRVMSSNQFLIPILLFALIVQFGYFSFGGSTVICVFEKVSCYLTSSNQAIMLIIYKKYDFLVKK